MSAHDNSRHPPSSLRQHEVLFKQLRDSSQGADPTPAVRGQDVQALHSKMDQWEQAYHDLREVEDSLVRAYSDLSN